MGAPTETRTERSLLLEIGLILALVVAGIVLYWGPVAAGRLLPRWWHWLVVGGLFFAVAGLHTWRARRRSQRALHRLIREDAATRDAERGPPEG